MDTTLNPCSMKVHNQGPPRLPASAHTNQKLFTVWSENPAISPYHFLASCGQGCCAGGWQPPALEGRGGVGAGGRALGLF